MDSESLNSMGAIKTYNSAAVNSAVYYPQMQCNIAVDMGEHDEDFLKALSLLQAHLELGTELLLFRNQSNDSSSRQQTLPKKATVECIRQWRPEVNRSAKSGTAPWDSRSADGKPAGEMKPMEIETYGEYPSMV